MSNAEPAPAHRSPAGAAANHLQGGEHRCCQRHRMHCPRHWRSHRQGRHQAGRNPWLRQAQKARNSLLQELHSSSCAAAFLGFRGPVARWPGSPSGYPCGARLLAATVARVSAAVSSSAPAVAGKGTAAIGAAAGGAAAHEENADHARQRENPEDGDEFVSWNSHVYHLQAGLEGALADQVDGRGVGVAAGGAEPAVLGRRRNPAAAHAPAAPPARSAICW